MSQPAIEVTGLQKRFGSQAVLKGINLKVPAGTIFALLGPNGAGKTTLINILSTLTAPDEGIAKVAGRDIASDKNGVKKSISLTGQFAAVDEMLTPEENLRMMGRLSDLTAAEASARAQELLRQFDLVESARKKVKTFSGGMRRRLDLAISLVVPKPVLFLDEPTTGLDTISRRALWEMIVKLREQGMTIFLTTQYLEEADQLADTIAVMGGGRIVALGTAQELKARIGGEVIELRDAADEVIRTLPTSGSIQDIRHLLGEVALTVPQDTKIGIRKPSLDDVFLALTANPKEEATL